MHIDAFAVTRPVLNPRLLPCLSLLCTQQRESTDASSETTNAKTGAKESDAGKDAGKDAKDARASARVSKGFKLLKFCEPHIVPRTPHNPNTYHILNSKHLDTQARANTGRWATGVGCELPVLASDGLLLTASVSA